MSEREFPLSRAGAQVKRGHRAVKRSHTESLSIVPMKKGAMVWVMGDDKEYVAKVTRSFHLSKLTFSLCFR